MPDCADDVEARVVEEPRDALAEQDGVVGEDDADGVAPGASAERGEVAAEARLVELEDPLRLRQLRQRPEAEIAEVARRCELERGRLGGDDLAAVAGVRDPERPVDLDADVAVVAERRRPGVQADPDPHRASARCGPRSAAAPRPPRRRRPRRRRTRRRARRRASRPRGRPRRRPPRGGGAEVRQHRLPVGAELAGEPRRALDVGEEEGDRSGRERAHPGESRSRERARTVRYAATSSSSGLRRAAYAKGW